MIRSMTQLCLRSALPLVLLTIVFALAVSPGRADGGLSISSLSPSTAPADTGFHLTINGAGFVAEDTVTWNGAPLEIYSLTSTRIVAGVSTAINGPQSTTIQVPITVKNTSSETATAYFTVTPTGPYLGAVGPTTVTAGGPAFTLTLVGNNFLPTSQVTFAGTNVPTTYISSTKLKAAIDASLISSAETAAVYVVNPGPITSNERTVVVSAGPTLLRLSQYGVLHGTTFTLTVAGTNLDSGAVINIDGTPLTTTFISSTHLSAVVPGSLTSTPGQYTITITDRGITTNGLILTAGLTPAIVSLSPDTAPADYGFHLTINGSGFITGDKVTWNGSSLPVYSVTSTQIVAGVSTAVNGPSTTTSQVTIRVTDPDKRFSTAQFTVTPTAPYIGSISPSTVAAGSPTFTLKLVGDNFDASGTVELNGSPIPTTFTSTMAVAATVDASLITSQGLDAVTFVNGAGISSGPRTLTVTGTGDVSITSLSPDTASADTSFHLTIHGAGFAAGDTVTWNGTPLQVYSTTATQIIAGVSTDVNGPSDTTEEVAIVVTSPTSQSSSAEFTVSPTAPYIGSVTPDSVTAGGPTFTLTLVGNNFDAGSTVEWDGSPIPTTFVSASKITATVDASLIASPGTADVTVLRSTGTLSGARTVTVTASP